MATTAAQPPETGRVTRRGPDGAHAERLGMGSGASGLKTRRLSTPGSMDRPGLLTGRTLGTPSSPSLPQPTIGIEEGDDSIEPSDPALILPGPPTS